MNEQVKAYLASYPEEIQVLFLRLREMIWESAEGEPEEKLWARLPSYYAGEKFVLLIPFRDHINIEAQAALQHRDELAGCKMTPKGMVQIPAGQALPEDALKKIFAETLS